MFQRLISFWRGQHRQPTMERRLWGRYPSDLATTLQALSPAEEARTAARVQNVSAGGIRLAVDRSFEPGTLLHVDLPGSTARPPSSLLASVIHVSLPAHGTWALGCSFIRELSDAELRLLREQQA